MPSLPARAIILSNTIHCDQTELPSMNKTYSRYNESLTNLSAAKNREKVLTRRMDKQKKHYLIEKTHNKVSSCTRDINQIDKLILSLHSMKDKKEIEKKLQNNTKRRDRTKRSLIDVRQRELAHKSSICYFVQKIKVENERYVEIERKKQQKLKEIVVMKERMREKKRAYNILQFYQNKIDNIKKRKELGVETLMSDVSKNEQQIDIANKSNVKLHLEREKSVNKIQKYRNTTNKRKKSVLVNPQ